MRALLLLAFLVVWLGFPLGSVGLAVYLAVTTARHRQPRLVERSPTLRFNRTTMCVEQALAVGAVFAAVYAILVGTSFLRSGNLGGFSFAVGPAITFTVLATATSLTLRFRSP